MMLFDRSTSHYYESIIFSAFLRGGSSGCASALRHFKIASYGGSYSNLRAIVL